MRELRYCVAHTLTGRYATRTFRISSLFTHMLQVLTFYCCKMCFIIHMEEVKHGKVSSNRRCCF
ncbi:hypothetical protein D5E88_24350 [Vibrio parahaemolyticus]|nr:hypothetical protein D5E88_24350 [Vibrio parahaemolyticus]TBT69674.1 hypothetical protein D5E74_24175 [Vibrio parahaemolyticus]